MRKAVRITMAVVALLLVSTATASVQETVAVKAKLTARQEVPRPDVAYTQATGKLTATLTRTAKGYRLSWRLRFRNLSGLARSAYIHRGKRGRFGAALFHLCSPCRSGARGIAYASAPIEALMVAGGTYVNIRTMKNPAGEIRGQVTTADGS